MRKKGIVRILTNPWVIVAGVVAGFLCGLFSKELAHAVEPVARLYLALLSMCTLPIMVNALVWGIAQMLRDPETGPLFGRLALIYGAGLVIPCVVGLIAVFALRPGDGLSEDAAALPGGRIDPVVEAEPETARSDSLFDRWHFYEEPGRGSFVTFIHDTENGSG